MGDLAECLGSQPLPKGLHPQLSPQTRSVENLAQGRDTLDDEESEPETEEPRSSSRPKRVRSRTPTQGTR
jgi:hypothetical protein